MKSEQENRYTRSKRFTAYLLLFLQLFLPLSTAFSGIANAMQPEASISNTIDGLDTFMSDASQERTETHPLLDAPIEKEKEKETDVLTNKSGNESKGSDYSDFGFMTLPSTPHDNTVRQDDILRALPNLGLPDEPKETEKSGEAYVAEGASKAGQILSNEDAIDASVGYARSLGENLVNQQINDWLNQYGKARVNLSSDKQIDADFLLPLIDTSNRIVFSQAGIRSTEDRNITNVGLGYRQYQDGWMWGVNSFYDYDITGGNSRVGVGSELWMDYLKLSGNGYFRVTDWHQSKLHEMRDYDERPANGFDVRAEGYLPSYPQLGAFAKYEQYFGNDISLSSSTSVGDLKNNPSKSTFGVSYTPFPLITLKGETSRGSSNDNKVGLELAYRLGVPLSRQLNSDNVDLMRSLAGNRYDFVDRNYDIVMQYRKQELITISLPESLNAEAADTVPVSATINKAKYGLASIDWSSPELIANGGSITSVSPNTINLTLPAYVFMTRSGEPQPYRLTAVGKDKEGNLSNTAVMWVNVKPSSDTITEINISPNGELLANNSDEYTVIAVAKNEQGEALPNKEITFSVTDFRDNTGLTITPAQATTDSQGFASVTIKSKVAGKGRLTATMKNGNSRSSNLIFKADSSTAEIKQLNLTQDKALANGKARNIAEALVEDQYGNPVENFALSASATNGAVIVGPAVSTNNTGLATTKFSNTTSGKSILTVEGTGTKRSVDSFFIADISTAKFKSTVVNSSDAVADGVRTNRVILTVVDGNGNPLENALITITVPTTAKYKTSPSNGLTNESGELIVDISNTKAGTSNNYIFEINGQNSQAELTFIADKSTAIVKSVILEGDEVAKIANSTNEFTYLVSVADAKGNPVKGITVVAEKDKSDTTLVVTGDTDDEGQTQVKLISTNKAVYQVMVSAKVGTTTASKADKAVSFTADTNGARVTEVTLVDKTMTEKVANGTNYFTFKAIVKDAAGNVVPNVDVTWNTDPTSTAVIYPQNTQTDEQGVALLKLMSTTAVVENLQVSAKSVSGDAIKANDKVSFIADKANASVVSVTLEGNETEKVANGSNSFTFKAKVQDSNGNPVPGVVVAWSKTTGPSMLPVLPGAVTDVNGISEITLTSSTKIDLNIAISAQYASSTKKTSEQTVSFVADKANAAVSELKLDGNVKAKVANGKNTFTYTAKVLDANQNPVAGMIVSSKANKEDVTVESTTPTNNLGETMVTLSSSKVAVEDILVSAQFGTSAAKSADQTVSFTANRDDAKVSELVLIGNEKEKIADGNSQFSYTATVLDDNANPIQGVAVTATASENDVSVSVEGKTNASGKVTIILKSTKTAVHNVWLKAQVGETDEETADQSVSFIANVDKAQITLNASTTSASAGKLLPIDITTVDNNGNAVAIDVVLAATPNTDVTFYKNSNKDGLDVANSIYTGDKGKVTVYVSSTKAQVFTVKGTITSNNANDSVKFTFTSDKDSAYVADLSPKGATLAEQVAGVDSIDFTATVLDQYGNTIDDVSVVFSANLGGFGDELKASLDADTDELGIASISFSSLKSGMATVNAKVATSGITKSEKVTFIANTKTAEVVELTSDRPIASVGTSVDLKAVVKDKNGNIVTKKHTVTIAVSGLDDAALANNSQSIELETDAKGEVHTTLTSPNSGMVSVLANTAENLQGQTIEVQFAPRSDTARVKALQVDKAEAFAGVEKDNAGATFTAQIVDDHGNLVPDSDVVFTVSELTGAGLVESKEQGIEGSPVTEITVKSNSKGVATVVLKSTKSGNATVKAATVKSPEIVISRQVSFTGNPRTAKFHLFEAVPSNTPAVAGVDTVTINAIIVDKNDNIVKETLVLFSSQRGELTSASAQTDATGKVSTVLSSKIARLVDYTAIISASAQAKSGQVEFVSNKATALIEQGSFKVTPEQPVVGSSKPAVVSAKVVDENGNPVSGVEVTFTTALGEFEQTTGKQEITVVTNDSGIATVTLSSNNTGKGSLTAKVTDSSEAASSAEVEFIAGSNTPYVSAFTLATSGDIKVGERVLMVVRTEPVGNVSVNFTASVAGTQFFASSTSDKEIDRVTTGTNGTANVYVVTPRIGTNQITASSSGEDVNNVVSLSTYANEALMQITHLTLAPESAIAGGDDAIVATAVVSDKYGNQIDGVPVIFTTSLGQFANGETQETQQTKQDTDGQSKAVVEVRSQKSGAVKVTAKLANGSSLEKSGAFTIASVDSLTALPESDITVGQSTTLTAKVVDSNGNALKGIVVTFVATEGAFTNSQKTISVTSQDDGTATASLTRTTVGDVTVKATTGSDTTGKDVKVNFVADKDNAHVTLLDAQGIANLTAGQSTALTINTADQYDNAIGTTVTLTTDNSDVAFFSDKEATKPLNGNNKIIVDASGKTTIYVVGKKAEKVTITANSAKTDLDSNNSVTFDVLVDVASAQVKEVLLSEPTMTSKIANNTDYFTYTATLEDKFGNLVTEAGLEVKWLADNTDVVFKPATTSKTNSQGEATIQLLSAKAVKDVFVSAVYPADQTTGGVTVDTGVTFITDAETAHVSGMSAETVTAEASQRLPVKIVTTDSTGNTIATQVTLASTPSNDVTFYGATDSEGAINSVTTNDEGEATVYVTSLAAQEITVVATTATKTPDVNNTVKLTFKGDSTTVHVVDMTLTPSSQTVGKLASVNITTQDSYMNPVSGTVKLSSENEKVTFYQDAEGKVTLPANSVQTDDSGKATVYVTSLKVQDVTILASSTNASLDVNNRQKVTFTADQATARVVDIAFTPETETVGKYVAVKVMAQDVYTNGVETTVTFSSSNENTVFYEDANGTTLLKDKAATTDVNGQVTVYFTNLKVESVTITAHSVNTSDDMNNSGAVKFIADKETAHVTNILAVDTSATVGNFAEIQIETADAYDNPVSSKVTFSSLPSAGVTFYQKAEDGTLLLIDSTIETSDQGNATIYVSSSKEQQIKVKGTTSTVVADVNNETGVITFTIGVPDSQKSTFETSPKVIPADNMEMSTLTLVLNDKDGKVVSGAASELNFAVTGKDSSTPDNDKIIVSAVTETDVKGTYIATFKGTLADVYTIVPQLHGLEIDGLSNTVTIVALAPEAMLSTISTNKDVYLNSDEMKVTVILKDKHGNPVSGVSPLLNEKTVIVPFSIDDVKWVDEGKGHYSWNTKVWTSSTRIDLKAVLKLEGWSTQVESNPYKVISTKGPNSINANGYTYASSAGFPKTGFKNARFQITANEGGGNANYNWSANQSWVSVSDTGLVTFIDVSNGQTVTILGEPKDGIGDSIRYSFTVTKWFIGGPASGYPADAKAVCEDPTKVPGNYTVAQYNDVFQSVQQSQRGEVGKLWPEWGDMTKYPGANFTSSRYVSTEYRARIYLTSGYRGVGMGELALCEKKL